MACPLAPGFLHMRRGLLTQRGRRRRYRRAGGMAPARAVPFARERLTLSALGPHPRGWRPSRSWHLRPAAPREQLLGRPAAEVRPRRKPEAQLGLNFWGEPTPPTSPVEPPARRGRARGPRPDAARVGANLGLPARAEIRSAVASPRARANDPQPACQPQPDQPPLADGHPPTLAADGGSRDRARVRGVAQRVAVRGPAA